MKKRWFILIIILSLLVIWFAIGLNNVDNKGLLKVTNEHPFLLDGKWVEAKDLKVGDELFTINGRKARITKVKDVNESVEVYNLEAGKYNDFIVEDGIVVHNSKKPELFTQVEEDVERFIELKDKLDKLVLEKEPGITFIPEGNQKNVYLIDGNYIDLDSLPENLRNFFKEEKGVFVIKFYKNEKGGSIVRYSDAMYEFSKREDITRALLLEGENIDFTPHVFERSISNSYGAAVGGTIEEAIPEKSVYAINQMLAERFLDQRYNANALLIAKKINQEADRFEGVLKKILVENNMQWDDAHFKNIAIGFTDELGVPLDLNDILKGSFKGADGNTYPIDINLIKPYFRAYEMGLKPLKPGQLPLGFSGFSGRMNIRYDTNRIPVQIKSFESGY